MATGGTYAEQGDEDFYERREHHNREHIAARHQQALARLGYQVTLTPIEPASLDNPLATTSPSQAA